MKKPPESGGFFGLKRVGLRSTRHVAANLVAGVADLVGQAVVAVGLAPGFLARVAGGTGGAGQVVTGVAEVLAHLVAGIADLVGDAVVAVGLAPGFLGRLLAFAVGALDVVH